MIIKILLLAGLATVSLAAVRGHTSAGHLALRRTGGTLLCVLGAFTVLFPEDVTRLANLVGVGRGTDLVLYILVLAFLLVSIRLYQRVHELQHQLTLVARALAVHEGLSTGTHPPSAPALSVKEADQ